MVVKRIYAYGEKSSKLGATHPRKLVEVTTPINYMTIAWIASARFEDSSQIDL